MDADDIRTRLKARGLKQVDLANFIGLDQNKLTKVLKGERRFKVEEMDKVRAFFSERPELPATDLRPIPLVGTIPGGNWREAVKHSLTSIPSPDPSIPPRAFALKVVGDSMDLYVDDGGTIIVDPDDVALFSGKFYAVANAEGETTFKRYKADPPRLVPCSSNAAHEEMLIGAEPFTVIGRIIWRAARM